MSYKQTHKKIRSMCFVLQDHLDQSKVTVGVLEKQLAEEKQRAKSNETLSGMGTGITYCFQNLQFIAVNKVLLLNILTQNVYTGLDRNHRESSFSFLKVLTVYNSFQIWRLKCLCETLILCLGKHFVVYLTACLDLTS